MRGLALPALVLLLVGGPACTRQPFETAAALQEAGKSREAAEAFRALARQQPASLAAWDRALELFCRQLVDVGECAKTLDLELQVLGKLDRHRELLGEVLERRARARLESGLVDAAIEDLERAEKASPSRVTVLVVRARAFLAKGQADLAQQTLERVKTLDPGNPEVRALWDELRAGGNEEEPFGGGALLNE